MYMYIYIYTYIYIYIYIYNVYIYIPMYIYIPLFCVYVIYGVCPSEEKTFKDILAWVRDQVETYLCMYTFIH